MGIVQVDMELHIIVEGESGLVPIVPKGLDLCHDCVPSGHHLFATKDLRMQDPVSLATILDLVKRLAVGPPIRLAPDRVDDVVDFHGVSNK